MATLVRLLLLVLSSFFYLPDFISILEELSKSVCWRYGFLKTRPPKCILFLNILQGRFITEDPELREIFFLWKKPESSLPTGFNRWARKVPLHICLLGNLRRGLPSDLSLKILPLVSAFVLTTERHISLMDESLVRSRLNLDSRLNEHSKNLEVSGLLVAVC